MRRTKIIATLGPATDEPGMLEKLINAGVDVFRLNYSHQTHAEHERRMKEIRKLSYQHKHAVAVIADLQGPKIRIEQFKDGNINLREGANFKINTELATEDGDETQVGVTYKELAKDVKADDKLLIDDGKVVLHVNSVKGPIIDCIVINGGELSNNKGINLQGGGLSASAVTEKDIDDMKHAAEIKVDFIAISFPRDGNDVKKARDMMKEHNCSAQLISKIERAEALNHIEEIIEGSDAIMIARGDLGVEIGDAALPPVQKSLIKMARDMDRAVITATQMMESMIEHKIPTRAEVFDVANAVIDGTDAVMLSGETSIGHYPDKVVEAMSRVCEEAEKQRSVRISDHRINQRFETISEAVAMSSMYAANHIGAKAICALTETGGTCLWMSRISSGLPIFAFTRNTSTRRRVGLYRGVYPMKFDITHTDPLEANKQMINQLIEFGAVEDGDIVIITKGDLRGKRGGTNNMKIIQVGQALEHTL
ncbi:MAG: pyruvate kinase [Proteobacteria bacterium]|nr:pyruvate kinase [Pseudomonadota bacterium]NOG60463.1 pyruvate kinase [Pseudomonadota bacterium]